MVSIFTRIIRGDLPGRFVWRDSRCAAFLTIAPITRGHTLVVPVEEVDHWIDLDRQLSAHLMDVARSVGRGLRRGLGASRVGLMIAGLEVPHAHLHVLPIGSEADLDFARADPHPDPVDLDGAAEALRDALEALGYAQAKAPPATG